MKLKNLVVAVGNGKKLCRDSKAMENRTREVVYSGKISTVSFACEFLREVGVVKFKWNTLLLKFYLFFSRLFFLLFATV